jgi:trans-aconitate methyltransferase
MGAWSRLVGGEFLTWLAPSRGLRWADISCDNGCSTEQIVDFTARHKVDALDPSAERLAHARTLLAGRQVTFHQSDAMALS